MTAVAATLSYTTDIILPGLGKAPRSLWGCCAPPPIWQESIPPRLTGIWSFSFVSDPRLDSRALYRQLRVILQHHSVLHHGHHPPWLSICSAITPGVPRFPHSVLAVKQSTKVNQPLACGIFLLYPARALIVGPYADSSKLSDTTTLT